MRRLSAVAALIGFLGALVTLFASDYGYLRQNVQLLFQRAEPFLAEYWDFFFRYSPFIFSLFAFGLLIISTRKLPKSVKQSLVGHSLGNVIVFENRDDLEYKSHLHQLLRTSTTVDIIGIGNSQFSEQDWGSAIDQAVGANHAVFRVLFLDPSGEHIRMREAEEGLEPEWLCNQVRVHIRYFEDTVERVSKQFSYGSDLMKYKFYDEFPSSNLILFDRKHAFFQPYFFSFRGRANPIVFLTTPHAETVRKISQEFDRLWNDAITWDELDQGTKKRKRQTRK
jgi:hypothetical protein